MIDKRNDPFRAFNFSLEIDDIPRGSFSEVSGLVADGDATDYREGTDKQLNTRKLPALRIKGIGQDGEYKRDYPQGETAAHLVGFTDIGHVGQDGEGADQPERPAPGLWDDLRAVQTAPSRRSAAISSVS